MDAKRRKNLQWPNVKVSALNVEVTSYNENHPLKAVEAFHKRRQNGTISFLTKQVTRLHFNIAISVETRACVQNKNWLKSGFLGGYFSFEAPGTYIRPWRYPLF